MASKHMNASSEDAAINKAIEDETTWDKLPKRLKLFVGSETEWSSRVKDYCIKKRCRWNECLAKMACKENEYYEDLMRYLRKSLAMFPYHLAEMVCRVMRVSPFKYYSEVIYEVLKHERSYDTIPNFAAADALHVTGIGRNEFIDIMNRCKAKKLMWKLNKSLAKEFLPSEPKEIDIQLWWHVAVVNLSLEEYKRLTQEELYVIDRVVKDGANLVAEFDMRVVQGLYRRGLVYIEVPVFPDDKFSVASLEGFISNRDQSYDDPMEELLYNVFVASSEKVTVAELAVTLQAEEWQLEAAFSQACRLGFAKRVLDPGGLLHGGPLPPNLIDDGPDSPTTDSGGGQLLDDDSSTPASEVPAMAGGAAGTEALLGVLGSLALMVDANLTSYLMMGSLSSRLKTLAVTLFEAGKLSDANVADIVADLQQIEGTRLEGELQRFADHAFSLRVVLQCLKQGYVPLQEPVAGTVASCPPAGGVGPAEQVSDSAGDMTGARILEGGPAGVKGELALTSVENGAAVGEISFIGANISVGENNAVGANSFMGENSAVGTNSAVGGSMRSTSDNSALDSAGSCAQRGEGKGRQDLKGRSSVEDRRADWAAVCSGQDGMQQAGGADEGDVEWQEWQRAHSELRGQLVADAEPARGLVQGQGQGKPGFRWAGARPDEGEGAAVDVMKSAAETPTVSTGGITPSLSTPGGGVGEVGGCVESGTMSPRMMAMRGVGKGRKDRFQVDILRVESLAGLAPGTVQRILHRDYAIVVSMVPLAMPPPAMWGPAGTGPVHFGPPSPAATTPWMRLLMYTAARAGPPSMALVRGQRLRVLPAQLAGCSHAGVWAWDGQGVGGMGGHGSEGSVVEGAILLHVLNSLLRYSAVLVQPLPASTYPTRGSTGLHAVDVPLPVVDTADGERDSTHLLSQHPTVQRLVKELQLSTLGYIRMLKLSSSPGDADESWVPWGLEFGVPLFDTKLCMQVCEGAIKARLFDPALLARHRTAISGLRLRLLDFIADYRANGRLARIFFLGETNGLGPGSPLELLLPSASVSPTSIDSLGRGAESPFSAESRRSSADRTGPAAFEDDALGEVSLPGVNLYFDGRQLSPVNIGHCLQGRLPAALVAEAARVTDGFSRRASLSA